MGGGEWRYVCVTGGKSTACTRQQDKASGRWVRQVPANQNTAAASHAPLRNARVRWGMGRAAKGMPRCRGGRGCLGTGPGKECQMEKLAQGVDGRDVDVDAVLKGSWQCTGDGVGR